MTAKWSPISSLNLHRNRCRFERHASHGDYDDTSPQNGCCRGTWSSSAGTIAESV